MHGGDAHQFDVEMHLQMSVFNSFKALMEDGDKDVVREHYNPWMINRIFMHFPDLVHFAQEMNKRPSIPAELQAEFYSNLVPKGRRYVNWIKQDKFPEGETIQNAHRGLSKRDIADMKRHLTKEQWSDMLKGFGGR